MSASPDPDVAAAAALFAEPARAAILYALLGGGELPASELAFRASASPQAASAHLAKLVNGGLLAVRAAGRQKFFRLASGEVGRAMEALAALAAPVRVRALAQDSAMRRLREARSCYDHLAGRVGVAITDGLTERGLVRRTGNAFAVTAAGARFFGALGIDLEPLRERHRSFARACMDWTERRPHVAGALGAALLQRFLEEGWFERAACDRALRVTVSGRRNLSRRFEVEFA
ncbi:MAG: winged helix-turn-helix transcriptional regulator [Candidatus Eremiobacteraeota bacterium]|nr:winged helix-turn-helix transcriptional regulator [Candidatus Eremiobacteraeota bacterium]